ncbi:MAG TPA: hypothetical protein VHX62_16835 [Solirubrobacteraceae bacterium]|jgi:hypothetical protein|nr:hypothetical protein [Solirubrobacteraceae bacterium]
MSSSHAVRSVHTPRLRVSTEAISIALIAAAAIALIVLAIVTSGSTTRTSTHSDRAFAPRTATTPAPALASPAQSVPNGYVRDPATHQLLRMTTPSSADPDTFGGMR